MWKRLHLTPLSMFVWFAICTFACITVRIASHIIRIVQTVADYERVFIIEVLWAYVKSTCSVSQTQIHGNLVAFVWAFSYYSIYVLSQIVSAEHSLSRFITL